MAYSCVFPGAKACQQKAMDTQNVVPVFCWCWQKGRPKPLAGQGLWFQKIQKMDNRGNCCNRQCFLSKEPKWNKVEHIKCPTRGWGRAAIGLGKWRKQECDHTGFVPLPRGGRSCNFLIHSSSVHHQDNQWGSWKQSTDRIWNRNELESSLSLSFCSSSPFPYSPNPHISWGGGGSVKDCLVCDSNMSDFALGQEFGNVFSLIGEPRKFWVDSENSGARKFKPEISGLWNLTRSTYCSLSCSKVRIFSDFAPGNFWLSQKILAVPFFGEKF